MSWLAYESRPVRLAENDRRAPYGWPVTRAATTPRRPVRPLASSSSLPFLSVFSGAGGLDLGLEAAGWQPFAQIECDDAAVGTLELAARRRSKSDEVVETRVIAAPIEGVAPRALRHSLGLKRGELPLLAGGPPCQPFTTHGLRQSIIDRRAAEVWPAYLRYVDEFKPRAVLIENVDGLLSAALRHRPLLERGGVAAPLGEDERKGSFLRWFVAELAQRGYAVSWGVAEAADYGVPQMRQRAIVIGVRGSRPCFLPRAEFGQAGQLPFRTLSDALADVHELGPVQPLSARKRAVYDLIPPGGNWRDLPERIQRATMGAAHSAEGGKSGWWRRLSWDLPAPTILGMPDHSSTALVHPDESRCLSVNECAAAQSFPRGTEFAGSGRAQYQQIGNAVPPLLGAALGRHVAKFLTTDFDDQPAEPLWRKASANRRIGTHGWAIARAPRQTEFHMNVKVRPDHVWADVVATAS